MVKRRKMSKTKGIHDVKLSGLERAFGNSLFHEHYFVAKDTGNLCLLECRSCKALFCNSCGKMITSSRPSQIHGKYSCT